VKHAWIKRLKEEVINIIPAIIYFIIAFNLIHFTIGIGQISDGIRYYSYFSLTIGGLIVGIVLIKANNLPIINAFPHKPLIYNIIWKFILYNIFIILIRMLEPILRFLFKYDSISIAWQFCKMMLASPIFWGVQMWLVLVLFAFVVFSEFTRVIGKNRVKQILFSKNP